MYQNEILQCNLMQQLNKCLFLFLVKYSLNPTGDVSVRLHLMSVNEMAVVITNVLTFTQHIHFDLVLWLSNIAQIPSHFSPCWSIALSPPSAYQRDEDTSLKIDKSHVYPFQKHILNSIWYRIYKSNICPPQKLHQNREKRP